MYVVMRNFVIVVCFQKVFLNNFDDLCFAYTYSTPYSSNAKSCKSFSLYFSIMKAFEDMGQ